METTPSEPRGIPSLVLYQLRAMVDETLPGSLREEALESFITIRRLDNEPGDANIAEATKLFFSLRDRFEAEQKFEEEYDVVDRQFRAIVNEVPSRERGDEASVTLRVIKLLEEYWQHRTSKLSASFQSRNSAVR